MLSDPLNWSERPGENSMCRIAGPFTATSGTLCAERILLGASNGQPGFFELQGGDVSVERFVADLGGNNGESVFNMYGGRLEVRKAGSVFALGSDWNVNAAYRLNLGAGELDTRLVDGAKIPLAFTVPQTEGVLVWKSGSLAAQVLSPMSGDGELRIESEGNVVLTDATRFCGKLDVAKGTAALAGDPSLADPESDLMDDKSCYRWTADDLQLEDGATVESWTDANFGNSAVSNKWAGSMFAPLLPVLEKNVFNGHAAVKFENSRSLAVDPRNNPLAGVSRFSLAVVFDTSDTFDNGTYGYYYAGAGTSVSMIYNGKAAAGTGDTRPGFKLTGVGKDQYGLGVRKEGAYGMTGVCSRPGHPVSGRVHVAIAVFDGEGYSLFLDNYVTNGVAASAPPFANLPLCFGSTGVDSANVVRSKVRIAEVRAYPDRVLSLSEQSRLASALSRKYRYSTLAGALAASDFDGNMPFLGGVPAAPAPVEEPRPYMVWSAETLAATHSDGAPVDSWSSTDASMAATAPEGAAPTFKADAFGGKGAVRFRAADKTHLQIPAEASAPHNGITEFAIAVVFRTRTDGKGGLTASEETNYARDKNWTSRPLSVITNITEMTGLFGTTGYEINTKINGTSTPTGRYRPKLTLAFSGEGVISGWCNDNSTGYYNGVFNRRPLRLYDGAAHVAVFTAKQGDNANGTMMVSVDKCIVSKTLWSAAKNGFGVGNTGIIGALTEATGFFDGDIAEIRFYRNFLTADEVRAVSESCARRFGFSLDTGRRGAYSADTIAVSGLGARDIRVRQGAVLSLPLSSTAPYVLRNGGVLHGEGEICGSLRVGEGGVLDESSERLARVGDLQFAGGVLKLGKNCSEPIPTGRFSVTEMTVELDAPAEGEAYPRRIPIAVYEDSANVEGSVLHVPGAKWARLKVDEKSRTVYLYPSLPGTVLIVR